MKLSFDIGGTTVKCGLFKDDKIVKKFEVSSETKLDLIENLYLESNKIFSSLNLDWKLLNGVCFSICGTLSKNQDIIIIAPNLGLYNYPLSEQVNKYFNVKYSALNDARAALMAEKSNAFSSKDSLLMYTLGTGVGGALFINGGLVEGEHGLASEPGHGGDFQNKSICNCGYGYCMEASSSATGITKNLNLVGSNKKSSLYKKWSINKNITIKDISIEFQKDNEELIDIFKTSLTPLAKHIATLIQMLDLDSIVIGGGVSKLGEKLNIILTDLVNEFLTDLFKNKFKIFTATTSNDAGIIGAYFFWTTMHNKKHI